MRQLFTPAHRFTSYQLGIPKRNQSASCEIKATGKKQTNIKKKQQGQPPRRGGVRTGFFPATSPPSLALVAGSHHRLVPRRRYTLSRRRRRRFCCSGGACQRVQSRPRCTGRVGPIPSVSIWACRPEGGGGPIQWY